MLSFPTPSWKKVAISTLKSSSAHQSGLPLGRTASLILPRLYLSDFFTARDEEAMTKLGITHMVSVMENMPTQMPQMVRYHIPIQDKGDADILQHLDGTTEFIREALSENPNNKVLVGSSFAFSVWFMGEHLVRSTAFRALAEVQLLSALS